MLTIKVTLGEEIINRHSRFGYINNFYSLTYYKPSHGGDFFHQSNDYYDVLLNLLINLNSSKTYKEQGLLNTINHTVKMCINSIFFTAKGRKSEEYKQLNEVYGRIFLTDKRTGVRRNRQILTELLKQRRVVENQAHGITMGNIGLRNGQSPAFVININNSPSYGANIAQNTWDFNEMQFKPMSLSSQYIENPLYKSFVINRFGFNSLTSSQRNFETEIHKNIYANRLFSYSGFSGNLHYGNTTTARTYKNLLNVFFASAYQGFFQKTLKKKTAFHKKIYASQINNYNQNQNNYYNKADYLFESISNSNQEEKINAVYETSYSGENIEFKAKANSLSQINSYQYSEINNNGIENSTSFRYVDYIKLFSFVQKVYKEALENTDINNFESNESIRRQTSQYELWQINNNYIYNRKSPIGNNLFVNEISSLKFAYNKLYSIVRSNISLNSKTAAQTDAVNNEYENISITQLRGYHIDSHKGISNKNMYESPYNLEIHEYKTEDIANNFYGDIERFINNYTNIVSRKINGFNSRLQFGFGDSNGFDKSITNTEHLHNYANGYLSNYMRHIHIGKQNSDTLIVRLNILHSILRKLSQANNYSQIYPGVHNRHIQINEGNVSFFNSLNSFKRESSELIEMHNYSKGYSIAYDDSIGIKEGNVTFLNSLNSFKRESSELNEAHNYSTRYSILYNNPLRINEGNVGFLNRLNSLKSESGELTKTYNHSKEYSVFYNNPLRINKRNVGFFGSLNSLKSESSELIKMYNYSMRYSILYNNPLRINEGNISFHKGLNTFKQKLSKLIDVNNYATLHDSYYSHNHQNNATIFNSFNFLNRNINKSEELSDDFNAYLSSIATADSTMHNRKINGNSNSIFENAWHHINNRLYRLISGLTEQKHFLSGNGKHKDYISYIMNKYTKAHIHKMNIDNKTAEFGNVYTTEDTAYNSHRAHDRFNYIKIGSDKFVSFPTTDSHLSYTGLAKNILAELHKYSQHNNKNIGQANQLSVISKKRAFIEENANYKSSENLLLAPVTDTSVLHNKNLFHKEGDYRIPALALKSSEKIKPAQEQDKISKPDQSSSANTVNREILSRGEVEKLVDKKMNALKETIIKSESNNSVIIAEQVLKSIEKNFRYEKARRS